MHPILVSFGSLHIFNLSVFLIVAWVTFSFLFWKQLRNQAIEEEKIFDLMFYSTLTSFVAARTVFVIFHFDKFSHSLLRILALWVQPGLSFYGGLFAGVAALLVLTKRKKVRFGLVLDSLALSLPLSFVVGAIGSFLDGTVVGKLSTYAWAVRYIGHPGARHPIQVYEILFFIGMIIALYFIDKRATKHSWSLGLVGIWFFLFLSLGMFAIELVQEGSVYFLGLSANQWILIACFAEAVGALYVRSGGNAVIAATNRKLLHGIKKMMGDIYGKINRRSVK